MTITADVVSVGIIVVVQLDMAAAVVVVVVVAVDGEDRKHNDDIDDVNVNGVAWLTTKKASTPFLLKITARRSINCSSDDSIIAIDKTGRRNDNTIDCFAFFGIIVDRFLFFFFFFFVVVVVVVVVGVSELVS